MKEVMYCVCGFSANSGNKLAKHLGTHGCQSAYAYESPVAVKKARTTSSLEVLRSQKTAIVAQDLMNMTIYDAQGKFLFLEF